MDKPENINWFDVVRNPKSYIERWVRQRNRECIKKYEKEVKNIVKEALHAIDKKTQYWL